MTVRPSVTNPQLLCDVLWFGSIGLPPVAAERPVYVGGESVSPCSVRPDVSGSMSEAWLVGLVLATGV